MPSTRIETTVRIPQDLHQWLVLEAHNRRDSLNGLVITALNGYRSAMAAIAAQDEARAAAMATDRRTGGRR